MSGRRASFGLLRRGRSSERGTSSVDRAGGGSAILRGARGSIVGVRHAVFAVGKRSVLRVRGLVLMRGCRHERRLRRLSRGSDTVCSARTQLAFRHAGALATLGCSADLAQNLVGLLVGDTAEVWNKVDAVVMAGRATLSTLASLFSSERQHVATVAAPVGAHVGEGLETMRNAVVDLLLVGVRLGIGLADTFCDDTRVALLVTCQPTV